MFLNWLSVNGKVHFFPRVSVLVSVICWLTKIDKMSWKTKIII